VNSSTDVGLPGAVSDLRAEYYYFRTRVRDCFRAALRISWTTPRTGLNFISLSVTYM